MWSACDSCPAFPTLDKLPGTVEFHSRCWLVATSDTSSRTVPGLVPGTMYLLYMGKLLKHPFSLSTSITRTKRYFTKQVLAI